MSQIEELRQIIVGDNAEQLSELKERIESIEARTKDVAEVLPPAIEAGIKQNDRLIDAFKTPVSETLKRTIRTEPTVYAEILYPVMAPSIRRAISQAISSLLATINQTTASATSVKGLGMRLESMRTGVPYAELALRRSIVYRVEHVYLIDRDTGLTIAECAAQGSGSLDSDAVSAMFSAIQSFVQDSFSHKEDDRLTDLKVGAHNVWVAHGAKAMLACVIYGNAPESLKTQLYDTLDTVRTDYALPLAAFDGDASGFAGIQQYLEPLLQLRLKEDVPREAKSGIGSVVLMGALLLTAGYFIYQWFDGKSKLNVVEHYLKQTPGVVVTTAFWQDDKITVEGLKDPDALLPYKVLAAHDIEPNLLDLKTIPFRSLESEMELQRFSNELDLPDEVSLENKQGRLVLAGEAPVLWLLGNDARLRQLAADKRLDISELTASEGSVRAYVVAQFEDASASIINRLIEQSVGKPWVEVSVGSITQLPN